MTTFNTTTNMLDMKLPNLKHLGKEPVTINLLRQIGATKLLQRFGMNNSNDSDEPFYIVADNPLNYARVCSLIDEKYVVRSCDYPIGTTDSPCYYPEYMIPKFNTHYEDR